MKRREFIAALAGAFVAPDPDKLLWKPGAKLISIPEKRFVVRYSFDEVQGAFVLPWVCYSKSMSKDQAILFARMKKHYHMAQGDLNFDVRLREFNGDPEMARLLNPHINECVWKGKSPLGRKHILRVPLLQETEAKSALE